MLFVVPDLAPRIELLTGLGAAVDPAGWPVVDPTEATTIAGVWAIGNTTSSAHKVIHAAAAADATAADATAAEAINEDLLHTDLRHRRRVAPAS